MWNIYVTEQTFWKYTIWYVALAVASAGVLTAVFVRSENRRFTAAFWPAVLGCTYTMEVFMLIVTRAYTYYPRLAADPFQDAVLGNFFSQYSVSAAAVLLCGLKRPGWWRLGFALAYFLIDVLFVRLGVYAHGWYRSVYTLAGFLIYSWAVGKWHRRLLEKHGRPLWLATLFLAVFAAAGNSVITPLKLLKLQIFTPGFMADMSEDHTCGALIFGVALIVIMIALRLWETRWYVKAAVMAALAAAQYALIPLGLLYTRPGWRAAVIAIDLLGYYGWTALFERLLHAGAGPPYVCASQRLIRRKLTATERGDIS